MPQQQPDGVHAGGFNDSADNMNFPTADPETGNVMASDRERAFAIREAARNGEFKWMAYFHLILALASMYTAMMLTNWNSPDGSDDNAAAAGAGAVVGNLTLDSCPTSTAGVHVGTGAANMWVKAVTSWLTCLLYGWILAAPAIFPDRDFTK